MDEPKQQSSEGICTSLAYGCVKAQAAYSISLMISSLAGNCVVQRPHQSDQHIREGSSKRVSDRGRASIELFEINILCKWQHVHVTVRNRQQFAAINILSFE